MAVISQTQLFTGTSSGNGMFCATGIYSSSQLLFGWTDRFDFSVMTSNNRSIVWRIALMSSLLCWFCPPRVCNGSITGLTLRATCTEISLASIGHFIGAGFYCPEDFVCQHLVPKHPHACYVVNVAFFHLKRHTRNPQPCHYDHGPEMSRLEFS